MADPYAPNPFALGVPWRHPWAEKLFAAVYFGDRSPEEELVATAMLMAIVGGFPLGFSPWKGAWR